MPRTTSSQRQTVRNFGTCLNFNGASDRVTSANVVNSATVTAAAWIKLPAIPAAASTVVGMFNGNGSSTFGFLMFVYTDGKIFGYGYDGSTHTTSAPTARIPLNQWTHVAVIANGTTLKSYMNGVEVGTTACGNVFASYTVPNVFVSGACTGVGSSTYIKAKIDDVRFYKRAITTTELTNLVYGISEPATTNIEFWWKFDEGSGTSATDSSATGDNGTITTATYSSDVFIIPRTTADSRNAASARSVVT